VVGDREEVVPGGEALESRLRNVPTPRNTPTVDTPSKLGFSVQGVTPQMSRQFPGLSGVEITKVEDDSPADNAGLEEEMVVTGYTIAGRSSAITNIADFRTFESQLKSGTSVMLQLKVPDEYSETVRISIRVK
jgi:C-terminal processing protease CtpA/Prc